MQHCIDETDRRRKIQEAYNIKNNITPKSIKTEVKTSLRLSPEEENSTVQELKIQSMIEKELLYNDTEELIKKLHLMMEKAAKRLEFERATILRDKIRGLETKL